jgi:hypothetical protein
LSLTTRKGLNNAPGSGYVTTLNHHLRDRDVAPECENATCSAWRSPSPGKWSQGAPSANNRPRSGGRAGDFIASRQKAQHAASCHEMVQGRTACTDKQVPGQRREFTQSLARRLRESSPRQGRRVRSTRSRLSIFSEGYVIRFVQIHGRWIEVGYYLQAALQYRATKVRPIGHPSGPARSASPSSLAIIWLSSDAAGREPSVARPARS